MAVWRQAVRPSTAVVGIGVSSHPDRRFIRLRTQHVTGQRVSPLHFGIEWQQTVALVWDNVRVDLGGMGWRTVLHPPARGMG